MGEELNARAFGIACAIMWGGLVALLELAAGTRYGERWRLLLADLYPGYSNEPGDLALGTTLAVLDGFVLGYLFAWLYNRLV